MSAPDRVVLGSERLTCGEIAAAARPETTVTLSPAGLDRIRDGHRAARRVADSRPVYGRSTGVGANRDQPATDPGHAHRLLTSHATAAGPAREPARVRATVAVRVHQLAVGRSGASPAVAEALLRLLSDGRLPAVPEAGTVGTGDLAPLATLLGYAAGLRPDAEGRTATDPVAFDAHDVLPVLSSNAATLADAALAVDALTGLLDAAVEIAALTATVLGGSTEPVDPLVAAAAPTPEVREVAERIRALRAGSDHRSGRIQDPFGLRCAPQVLGAASEAVRSLGRLVEGYVGAGLENPMIQGTEAAHHGSFYALDVALALDRARLAVAAAAAQSADRVGLLLDSRISGLPAFLTDGTPGASGAMGLEYAAASTVAELRALAAPATLQSAHLSRGAEESAPFTSLAARQTLETAPRLRTVLACELVAAVRGARMLPPDRAVGGALGALLDRCAVLPTSTADRDLSGDVATAETLMAPSTLPM